MSLLQSRINYIEQLIKRQAAPVKLLNTIIQGIPRNGNLWITSLTQKSGSVKISGFTQQTEAIPELMNNLATSGIFVSVDLEDIESREEASKFSLLCSDIKKTEVERSHGRP
jgi:Tfp pilus assembly protein PilN